MREHRRRILAALADYGSRRGCGPIPGRKAEVLTILKEIEKGRGIEPSPVQWRDRTTAMVDAAIAKGADQQQAHELGADFLATMHRRFEALEAALWSWAYDETRRHPPLYLPTSAVDDFETLCVRLLALARRAT